MHKSANASNQDKEVRRTESWSGPEKQNEGGKHTKVFCLPGTVSLFSVSFFEHQTSSAIGWVIHRKASFLHPVPCGKKKITKYQLKMSFCSDGDFKVPLKYLVENVGWLLEEYIQGLCAEVQIQLFSSPVSQSVQHSSNISKVLPEAYKHIRKSTALSTWAHLELNHVCSSCPDDTMSWRWLRPTILFGWVQTCKCVSIQSFVIISFIR